MPAFSDFEDAGEARRQLLAAFCYHHLDEAAHRKGMDCDDDGEADAGDELPSLQTFRFAAMWMPLFNRIVSGMGRRSSDRQELRDRLIVLLGLGLDLERRVGMPLPISSALIVAARLQGTPECLIHRVDGDQHWIEVTPAGEAKLALSGRFPLDLTPCDGCAFQI